MEEIIGIRNAKELLRGELNNGAIKFVLSAFTPAGGRKRYALSLVGDARTVRAALAQVVSGKVELEDC